MMVPIAFLLLAVVLSSAGAGYAVPRKVRTAVEARAAQTTLRARDLSFIQGTTRGQNDIRNIGVTVANVGRVVAHGVQVGARLPGGGHVVLRGPKTLPAGAKALYVSSSKTVIIGAGRIDVRASCAECR